MKAIRLHGYNWFDSINYEDAPDPEPMAGRVIVRLKASSLNHKELFAIRPREGEERAPHIPGADGAGVIESVGEGVTDWKPGDEVIINPAIGDPEDDDFQVLGTQSPGTHAEFVSVPAGNLVAKPANIGWEDAAALPLCLMTAWRQTVVKGEVKPGEWVLIHGIGGGVAVYALQIAKLAGARVMVTSGDEGKLGKARVLGADYTLNRRHAEILKEVAQITGGHGIDLVIDNVGADTFPISLAVARIGGRVVMAGNVSGEPITFNPAPLYWKSLRVTGSLMGSAAELGVAMSMVGEGKIKAVVDSVFPLESYRAAIEKMAEGKQFGKIALGR